MLEFTVKHDRRIQEIITTLPKNEKYIHHSIQDHLLSVMSKMVLQKIAEEVKASCYFALFADGTKDRSNFRLSFAISIVEQYMNVYLDTTHARH